MLGVAFFVLSVWQVRLRVGKCAWLGVLKLSWVSVVRLSVVMLVLTWLG